MKHLAKLSLAILISVCFVFQAHIAKPLAEALTQSTTSAQKALDGVVGATAEDISQNTTTDNTISTDNTTLPSEKTSSDGTNTDATNEGAFSWDPSTKVLTIQGNCTAQEIKTELSGEATQAEEVCFSGTIVITTDQRYAFPFSGAANLARITATEGTRVSFTAAQGDDNPTLVYFFMSCSKLQSIAGLSSWDVSNVTGDRCMYAMFADCSALTSLEPLSDWNVSNVTGDSCMSDMFYGCSALTSLKPLSDWNVSGVAGDYCMNRMFYGCSALTSLEPLSDWTVSNVTGTNCMSNMFYNCTSLTSLDGLSDWDVSGVTGTNCMYSMFSGCSSLKNIEAISSWKLENAIRSNQGVYFMFGGCPISYIAGAPSADEGFIPTSDMGISNLEAAKTWYPAEGGASVSGDSLLTGWTGDTGYAAQSSRWALATDSGADPYVSTPLSWDPSELPATYTYTGSLIPYNPEVSAGTQTLTKGTDYRLSYLYTSGNEEKVVGGLKEPGSYVVSVVPQGNYTKAPSNTAIVRVVAGSVYTVSFDTEGGTPEPSSQEVEEGALIVEPAQPEKEGYSFVGWYRQGSDTPWNFASDTMPAEDIVLYAHWQEEPTPGPAPLPVPLPTPSENPTGEGLSPEQQQEIIQGIQDILDKKVSPDEADPYIRYMYETYVKPYLEGKLPLSALPQFLQDYFRQKGILPLTGDRTASWLAALLPLLFSGAGVGVAAVATYVARKRKAARK